MCTAAPEGEGLLVEVLGVEVHDLGLLAHRLANSLYDACKGP